MNAPTPNRSTNQPGNPTTTKSDTKSWTVNGRKLTYTTRSIPAREGIRIMAGLSQHLPSEVFALFAGMSGNQAAEFMNSDDPNIAGARTAAIVKALGSVYEDDRYQLLVDLLQNTECDSVRYGAGDDASGAVSLTEHFDAHFAGRYAHLANVLIWVASFNFGGP